MHEDLDLSVIERHHDADPQFREAVRTRLVAILDGSDALDVADHLPVQSTEEEATMIDLETPSETDEHRTGPKRMLLAGLLAAAALVAIVVVVETRGDDTTPADQPSPTVTVPPTTPPRALVEAAKDPEQLAPGTYFLDGVAQSTTARIFLTVDSGWSTDGGMLLRRSGVRDYDGFIVFDRPVEMYSDACHWKEGNRPGGPETTLDGAVAAFTEQKGWADVTTPSDISIDGYTGKTFQRTAPNDISDCDTTTSRRTPTSPSGPHPEFGYNQPGETETIWVVDIDGTVVVILARQYPEASAAARAEIAAVLESIRIEQL